MTLTKLYYFLVGFATAFSLMLIPALWMKKENEREEYFNMMKDLKLNEHIKELEKKVKKYEKNNNNKE